MKRFTSRVSFFQLMVLLSVMLIIFRQPTDVAAASPDFGGMFQLYDIDSAYNFNDANGKPQSISISELTGEQTKTLVNYLQSVDLLDSFKAVVNLISLADNRLTTNQLNLKYKILARPITIDGNTDTVDVLLSKLLEDKGYQKNDYKKLPELFADLAQDLDTMKNKKSLVNFVALVDSLIQGTSYIPGGSFLPKLELLERMIPRYSGDPGVANLLLYNTYRKLGVAREFLMTIQLPDHVATGTG